jgi:hypothetical protein
MMISKNWDELLLCAPRDAVCHDLHHDEAAAHLRCVLV